MNAWKNWGRLSLMTLLVLGLTVGCDDDGGDTDAGPGTDSGPGEDAGPPAPGNTIADIAAANPDFSTLVAAATEADLVGLLSAPGDFTVFAPTNAAFEASGITDLSAFTSEELRGILAYHAIMGQALMSGDLTAGPVDTAADLTLFIGTEGGVTVNGGNMVTGGAAVTMADIEADNGVIHVIDRVLLPPNIVMAASYGGLTGLLGAATTASPVGATSVPDLLMDPDANYTVFAPTNDAFDALTAMPDADGLRDVLLYHVIAGDAAIPSTGITGLSVQPSALANEYGNQVSLIANNDPAVNVNGATVVIADIRCTNGIVHVIDSVLLPPNIVDMVGIAGLTELGNAVGAASPLMGGTTIADALSAQEPYTVFAPTDDAFSRVSPAPDADGLRAVLLHHVVNAGAPVLSTGIPATADALDMGTLTFDTAATPPTVNGNGGTAGGSPANIDLVDINVTNGVVHVISEVLLP